MPKSKQFVDLLETYCDVKVHSYSGRFMMGRRCVAITCAGPGELVKAVAALTCHVATDEAEYEFAEEGPDRPDKPEFSTRDLHDCLRNLRQDSMGLDTVYYWPDLTWEDSPSPNHEDADAS